MVRYFLSVTVITSFMLPKCAWANVSFTEVHSAFFATKGSQAVAWADYDLDGDLDLAVSFKDGKVHLYQQNKGEFALVSKPIGLPIESSDYRSLSWGDYNNDGYPDLFVGFGRDAGHRNILLRGDGERFTNVADNLGVNAIGTTRQSVWVDIDNDGDSDLFVAMRDRTSKMFRNDGQHFTDISAKVGLNDPRRSVASVWLDYDQDGDLDLFLPNQSGDRDGLYQNHDGTFIDVAAKLNIDRPRRSLKEGSVGATLCDVNNDGHADIFVPVYGKDMLYIADGKGGFTNRAQEWGVDSPDKAVSADCGDVNNDGLMDLYVVAYQTGLANGFDHLYINQGSKFIDSLPKNMAVNDGDHGVRFADFDNDGDLDLAISNRHKDGRVSVWKNNLTSDADAHYLKITVLDQNGYYTRQGDEVRLYKEGTREILGFSIVDTGGGYISQNIQPIHLGLGSMTRVDVEITSMSPSGRVVQRLEGISANQHITVRVKDGIQSD